MRFFLTALFLLLYVLNGIVLKDMFPEITEGETRLVRLDAFGDFWVMRSKIYELMFLVLLFIPRFKRTRHSHCLMSATALFVTGSLLDKLTGQYGYQFHDLWLVVAAAFLYAAQYKRYQPTR